MVKKIQYSLLFLALVLLFSGFSLQRKSGTGSIKTIVIDPGHGGLDPGCHGTTHNEKDIALSVALKLGKHLESYYKDVKVVYTRTTDVFVELEDRAQIANKARADLFISIHCNAAAKPVMVKDAKTGAIRKKVYKNKKGRLIPVETINPAPFGTETYVMGLKNEADKMRVATRENSAILLEDDYEKKYGGFDPESEESYIIMSNYTSAYVIQSANLAVKIQQEYTNKAGRIDKGVHRQSIWVLWRTSMPSILTEIGYLTNPLEETFMASEKGQDYLAKAMFRGIRKYKDEVEGAKKEYDDGYENEPPLENENVKAGNLFNSKKNEDDEKDGFILQKETPDSSNESTNKVLVNDGRGNTVILNAAKNSVTDNDTVDNKPEKSSELGTITKAEPAETATVVATALKQEIVFTVQVASAAQPLDFKPRKYTYLVEPGFYKFSGTLKYTSGNFTKLDAAVAHQTYLRQHGFEDCFVIALKNGQRVNLAEARKILGQ